LLFCHRHRYHCLIGATQMHLFTILDVVPTSLVLEYDVVTGHGVYAELERLMTLVNKDLLELHAICTKRYKFAAASGSNDSVIDALSSVDEQVAHSSIFTTQTSYTEFVQTQASDIN